jgi:hypothetical protein
VCALHLHILIGQFAPSLEFKHEQLLHLHLQVALAEIQSLHKLALLQVAIQTGSAQIGVLAQTIIKLELVPIQIIVLQMRANPKKQNIVQLTSVNNLMLLD